MAVNGTLSSWQDVLSGIPQGSVLGPILFVVYINTLPEVVENSEVFLFADDTKAFKEVHTKNDCDSLQTDINNMYKWTEKSLLKFHPDKCGIMRIGKTVDKDRIYTMGHDNHPLKVIKEEKDIGVIIDDKLSFSSHMSTKINKANAIMGTIRRTYAYMDEESFLLLYKALVRPHLEYANQVWAPNLKKDIVAIENVQRRATKLIPGYKDLTYKERLEHLKLPTLAYRRLRGDMIEMYKILTGKYDPNVSDFVKVNTNDRRGHQLKVFKQHTRLNLRKYSFVHRSVNLWNSLPEGVVNAPKTHTFERRLDKLWAKEPIKFDMDAQPPYTTTSGMRTARTGVYADLIPEADAYTSEEDL